MKKLAYLSLAGAFLAGSQVSAQDLTLGSVSGSWAYVNTTPGGGIFAAAPSVGAPGTTTTLKWGDVSTTLPSAYRDRSSYTFQSAYVSPSSLTFDSGNGFSQFIQLGTFTHRNYPITSSSKSLTSTGLALSFDFGGTTVAAGPINFTHKETTNPTGDPVTVVGIDNSPVNFSMGGFDYTLTLLGVSLDGSLTSDDGSWLGSFKTPESKMNTWTERVCKGKDWFGRCTGYKNVTHSEFVEGITTAYLYAEITMLPPANVVPEPSTYALMAAGLAGLGFAARRRRKA